MGCSSWGPRCCCQNDLRSWPSSSPSTCLSLKPSEHYLPSLSSEFWHCKRNHCLGPLHEDTPFCIATSLVAYSLLLWRVPSLTSFSVDARSLGFLCHHVRLPLSSPPATRPPEWRLGSYCLTSGRSWKPRFPVGFLPLEAPVGTVVYTFSQNHLAQTYRSLEHSEPTWISSAYSSGKAAPCLWLTYFSNPQGSEEDCLCFWDTVLSGRQDSRKGNRKIVLFHGHDSVA